MSKFRAAVERAQSASHYELDVDVEVEADNWNEAASKAEQVARRDHSLLNVDRYYVHQLTLIS